MNPPILTRAQSRRVDELAIEKYGLSGLVLMENAGRGVADRLCQLGIAGPVVICCGSGNNAGDGFVIARHLDLRGIDVRVLLWAGSSKLAGDAWENYRIRTRTGVPVEMYSETYDAVRVRRLLAKAGWIVDALLGTGSQGEPRPPLDSVIGQLNTAAASKLAVDVPSGLDCDTGQPSEQTVRAAVTCTFVAAKPGLLAPEADRYVGELHVLDIGAPRKLIDDVLAE